MGSFDTSGIAFFAVLGIGAFIFLAGGAVGFVLASIINLGKLCL